jgi:hypothetical protein
MVVMRRWIPLLDIARGKPHLQPVSKSLSCIAQLALQETAVHHTYEHRIQL